MRDIINLVDRNSIKIENINKNSNKIFKFKKYQNIKEYWKYIKNIMNVANHTNDFENKFKYSEIRRI